MGTVTISGNQYPIYSADLATIKIYLLAAVGSGPDAWNASTDDALKSKFAAASKRYLDEMVWQGAQTVAPPTQTDAWPRSGVVDGKGVAVDSATVPTLIKSAEAELAAILFGDPTVNAALRTGSNVHRVDAKGVSVQFFRPTDVPGTATKMPVVVQRLVGQFLASAVGNSSAGAYYHSNSPNCATECVDSSFDDDAIEDRSGPFG